MSGVVTGRLHLGVQAWLEWVLCLVTMFPMDSHVNVWPQTHCMLVILLGQWMQSISFSHLNLQREKKAHDTPLNCAHFIFNISYVVLLLERFS